MTTSVSRPILDWRVRVEDLGGVPREVSFEAPATSLDALAAAIGVDRVLSCWSDLRLDPRGETVGARGRVHAAVVQTCGVSLEPFEAEIDEPVEATFAPGDPDLAAAGRLTEGEEGSAGMADRPEPIANGAVDLGAIVQEFLALGVDPYPRKPGVEFQSPTRDDAPPSPFAALSRIRRDPPAGGD